MSQPTSQNILDKNFFDKHKEKIYIGLIFYLFGSNQETQSQYKRATDRADKAEQAYIKRLNDEILAANKIAFRQMLDSDTTYIFGPDSVFRFAPFDPDSTKK